MSSPSRYEGKPLLRLLECYVLWAIDELPDEYAERLARMTPKLQAVYGLQGSWQEVIVEAVQLPRNLPDLIRELWRKNTEIAHKNGTTLPPQQFAEMFVDENLTG